ncbi:MAG TPA: WD40 repeat domain-containing protein, partial [Aggregatilineales bacterium]|nr:WD40 repeat domain-containing protein [Aggregatilineales bacterium]
TESDARVMEFIFDPDGRIGVHTADNTVTWYPSGESLESVGSNTYPLAVNPESGFAVGVDNTVTVNDAPVIIHSDSVTDIGFSADGAWIASTGLDNAVGVYGFAEETFYGLTGYDAPAGNLLFSPDNRVLVSTNPTLNQFRFLVLETGQQVTLPGSAPLAFSPDGDYIAYVRDQNTAVISRMEGVITERVESLIARLEGHSAPVMDLAFRPDGQLIATASRDGTISLWNPVTGAENTVLMGHAAPVIRLAFQGDLLASGGEDGKVILWDSETGEKLHEMTGHAVPVTALAFHPDGEHLISGDSTGRVIVWGLGDVVALPEISDHLMPEPTTVSLEMIDAGVIGTVQADLNAGYDPDHAVGCFIAENERILAVARSPQGAYLVFSESDTCDGAVWIMADSRFFDWSDFSRAVDLPIITPPESSPRIRLANYDAICSAASGSASLPEKPVHLYPPDFVPEDVQASLESGLEVIICHQYSTIAIGNCHYRPET